MTCIAVKVNKSTIEISGDSQTTWGDHKLPKRDTTDKHIHANGKVFQVNGYTFGCAGAVAHIGLLQVFAKTHQPKEMERDSILEWFIEFKDWCLAKAKVPYVDINIHAIIVKDGIAFTFYDFLEAVKVTEFDAIGSGMFLAMGAMECGATAEQAVNVAIKYDLYCGGKATKLVLKS